MHTKMIRFAFLALLLFLTVTASAQSQLAATLEVLASGVSVRRVNTQEFIPVIREAIVGVGDTIRTDATGRVRITFFSDGVDTELLPNTEYAITQFEGAGESFQITVQVVLGQTVQRLQRLLDSNSSYNINTNGMTLAARGTQFSVRVEASGRSGMLVTEGNVDATSGEATASVPPSFGIRADRATGLSDVVKASTFDELDAAIDGCSAVLTLADDVSLNVRTAPRRDGRQIGYATAEDVAQILGTNQSANWYRIAFADGYGWVSVANVSIDENCAGIRIFADDFDEEAGATQPDDSNDS